MPAVEDEWLLAEPEPIPPIEDESPLAEAQPVPVLEAESLPAEPEPPPPIEEQTLPDIPKPVSPVQAGPLPPIPTPPSFKPASLPPPSAPMPPRVASVPPAQLRSFIPSLAPTAMTPDADSTLRRAAVPRPRSRGKLAALLAAAVATAGIAAGIVLMMPGKGTLRVYVAGPQGQDIGPVNVYVDNNKVCSSSPCAVEALEPGIHDVFAEANGYARTATKGVEIKRGRDAKLAVDLLQSSTGFKVAATQQGILLEVDGSQVGPLPQTLTALSPGEHKLRFVGSDRYAALARTITVLPNRVDDLGEIKLDVIQGRATFELASTDVRMRLVSAQGDAREIDEQMFEDHRLSVDLDSSKDWKLQACSPGHEFLELPISFADGEAEKTFRVELAKNASRARTRLESWCQGQKGGAAARTAPATPATAGIHGGGTLNINSVPASAAVVLDGKPIGRTPMSGVKVGAGTHTVIFIHPEKGRKSASVSVGAGQSRGVGVRF